VTARAAATANPARAGSRPARSGVRSGTGALLLVAVLAAPARGQEFAAPAPACDRSPAALLERALPPGPGIELGALAIRWHALPELVTRSLTAGLAWRSVRLAAGVSQTGEPDLGWSAAALGVGLAGEAAGVGVRGAARRREAPVHGAAATGIEAGAGAWARAAPQVEVWAAAPQIWTGGEAPPLERWLEIGAVARAAGSMAWVARAGAPGAPRGLRAEHLAGIGLALGPATLWLEARDHPARGTLGVAGGAGPLRAAVAVESHPVLGETVRVALTVGGGDR
jgi:hypothetical protein